MADAQVPGMIACHCRRIHHLRNPCHNPARYCNWCKDGGCTIARHNEAHAVREEARAARSGGAGGGDRYGYHGPPAMAMTFGSPFEAPRMFILGVGGEEDEDEDEDEDGPD